VTATKEMNYNADNAFV